MILCWNWTSEPVKNQVSLCLMHNSESHINPFVSPGIPLRRGPGQSTTHHQTMNNFLGRKLYTDFWMCGCDTHQSREQIIKYDMILWWNLIIEQVSYQITLRWMHLYEAHINPSVPSGIPLRRVPYLDVTFLYTISHLSELQRFTLSHSTNIFIFIFK